MAKFKIKFEVELSDDVSDDEVYAWARFELGETACLEGCNRLSGEELEAEFCSVEVDRMY